MTDVRDVAVVEQPRKLAGNARLLVCLQKFSDHCSAVTGLLCAEKRLALLHKIACLDTLLHSLLLLCCLNNACTAQMPQMLP
jgi:hypothetical protein